MSPVKVILSLKFFLLFSRAMCFMQIILQSTRNKLSGKQISYTDFQMPMFSIAALLAYVAFHLRKVNDPFVLLYNVIFRYFKKKWTSETFALICDFDNKQVTCVHSLPSFNTTYIPCCQSCMPHVPLLIAPLNALMKLGIFPPSSWKYCVA